MSVIQISQFNDYLWMGKGILLIILLIKQYTKTVDSVESML